MAVAVAVFVAVTSFVSAETYEIPTECPNSLNETTLLAHEYDCTKYYKCFNGQKQSMDCPVFIPGHKKYFDVVSQSCILPWKSKCVSQAFDCFTDGYVQSHPYNCSLYYVCTNGEKVENSCKEGELFDSKSMKCVAKEKATCNVYQNTCPNGKFGPVFLPHECKCQSLYYECIEGEFIEKHCQKGKDFDVETGKCVLSQNVGCNATTTINDCPATGIAYIPDKFDCSSYYVCKNGVKSKKICDFGLSYNEERSMCTWPPSSMCSSKLLKPKKATPNAIEEVISRKCPPKGSEGKAVKFPHECSCAIYYECKDGQLLRETCPNGLIYDYVREVCDYPYRAKCAKKQKFNYNFARANSECPPTGHARIPHETKCSLYYECNNGKKRLQSCLQGHYFNPLIESCDLPWNTNCNNSPIGPPSNDSNSTSECTECGCNNCITRFPDPQNCSLYYQCENGEKVSKACPEHLYYDNVNQICDFPNNVDCKQKCKEGEKQQHECQCNKYYECINGQQVLKTCPNGQYFDRKKKICVESHTCPGQVDIGCIGTCSSFHSTEYLLHKDCDKHCVCENGSPYIVNCPKKQVYNPKSQTCDWPENVANLTCDPFPCDSNSKEDYLPHECHCDKYFVCRNGMKYRENCGEGKYFDYEKEICVNINQVHCYRGKKLKSES